MGNFGLAGVDLQRPLGARVEVWSVDDVARHLPAMSVEGVLSATYGPDDGMGVPLDAVRSLVEACQRPRRADLGGLGGVVHRGQQRPRERGANRG